ncbi:MAG: ATPase, E1-E2 type:Copper-translocating P-type ATPase:Heavy metal translocating P-type ATPase, partial [Parcubacteria group bacterium GW2011_GWC1_39_29]
RFIRRGQANMETLIGLGTSAAYIYSMVIAIWGQNLKNYIDISSTYFDVAIVVIAFIALGEYLEARSKFRTGDAIEKLLNLSAKTALVIRDGREVEISVDQVIHEDLIVVKPAGKIPVDGIITEGSSYIDEAMISGEPIPVQKEVGDRVIAGTINTTGYFVFRATGVGSETLLFRIIKMVGEAQSSKAPIQALADKISGVFVPIVLILSFAALAAWLIVGTQYLGFAQALSSGLVSFVGILVIACPCALGLATPTAIIVGVGKAAQEGVLIKDAATLQKLHQANVLVVDKTGTITKGKPEFLSLKNYSSKTDLEMISILASLEKKSEHPIAQAIIDHAIKENIAVLVADRFEIIKGRGLKGVIDGIEYFAGSVKYMNDLGLSVGDEVIKGETTEGKTPVILATGDKILSVAMVADAIKAEAVGSIANLHKLGFEIVMATGDDKNTAEYIAKRVGIDKVFAEVMPEDKLQIIKKLQSEGRIVVMAGDGVNDAPALAQADIGIAMATGTDVAIESAGITLLHGDISKIVKAINLSKATMRGIKQNLFWAFFYNIIGIPLAGGAFYPLFGWLLSPVFAGMAMAFSSVSVVTNSLRLKNKKI